MKKNLIAGFWIRTMARTIDLIFLFSIIFCTFWFNIEKRGEILYFKYIYAYYLTMVLFISLLPLYFILLPFFFKGNTLGNFIFRIKLKEDVGQSKLMSYFKRELPFSVSWSFLAILSTLILNHTLFLKVTDMKYNSDGYSTWEVIRISVIQSFGYMVSLIQLLILVTILVKGRKKSFLDLYSKSKIIYINKYIEEQNNIFNDELTRKLKPSYSYGSKTYIERMN